MGERALEHLRFRDFALGQAGVFTRAQAYEYELTKHAFSRGTRCGEWRRYRGVWMLTGCLEGARSRTWAALLRSGSGARVTGPTAISLRYPQLTNDLVYLAVPSANHRQLEGVVFLRETKLEAARYFLDGIPSVSPQRAIVDSLRVLDPNDARDVLHEALRLNWISPDDLDRWSTALRGHKGNAQLRIMAKYAMSGSRAESERIMLAILRAAGITGWIANSPIHEGNRLLGVGDVVFRKLKIVIEVDGWAWHSAHDRFERDRIRQNDLVTASWTVVRFTWKNLTDNPHYVVATVREAIALRELGNPAGISSNRPN